MEEKVMTTWIGLTRSQVSLGLSKKHYQGSESTLKIGK